MPTSVARPRPAVLAERALVRAILKGRFQPGAALPAERVLARRLGVTRPTLREALQRLNRDGWIAIRQGKETRVNDVWRHGGLGVLSAAVHHEHDLPRDFVPNLLEVREALAPAYAAAAVERAPADVLAALVPVDALADDAAVFARFDWALHRALAEASRNPIHSLILNGFAGFYERMALRYFASAEARRASRAFYGTLRAAAVRGDARAAQRATSRAMRASVLLWRRAEARP